MALPGFHQTGKTLKLGYMASMDEAIQSQVELLFAYIFTENNQSLGPHAWTQD